MARQFIFFLPALLLALAYVATSPASADRAVPDLPRTMETATPQPSTPQPPTPPNAPKDPEPAVNEAAEWFVSPAGKALGPYTISQLRELAADGTIDGRTPVWKAGMTDWVLLREVAELEAIVVAKPKPDEPPPPPKNTQALLDAAMLDYFVGTWALNSSISDAGYRYDVYVEITYRKDGTYAGTQAVQTLVAPGSTPTPPFVSARTGAFEVTAIDDSHFVLHLYERTKTGTETSQISFRIVDRNTIENTTSKGPVYRVR